MEVIVKSSPKIEIELTSKVVRVESDNIVIDSALSTTSENPVQNKVVTEELGKKVEGYFGLIKQINSPADDYLDEWGESISIPLGIEISDSLEIKVSYYDSWIESTDYLSLNKENNFYDEAWNDSGDYFFQAKYANGALLLEEPNNFSVGNFQRVEVYNVKPIEESLIPNTIARTEDVNAINAEQNERISELREETTALWGDMENKVDHSDLATINGQRIDEGGNIEIESGGDFDAEGNYPMLHVGTADDLAGRGESVPASFGFRASGGKSIKDGRAYIKRIKGNSVVWNQLCKPFANADVKPKIDYTFLDNGGVSVSSWAAYEPFRFNVGLTRNAGHKFLLMAEYTNTSSTKTLTVEVGTQYITRNDEKGTIATIGTIAVKDNTFADYISIHPTSVQDGIVTIQGLRFIDLTQMFQAGNEPSTIEDFNARVATLGVDMYAYNEGQVINCNTESIKSVGDNAWDEEWEVGSITDGASVDNASRFRSKNYISVLPNSEYYITPPSAMTSNNIMVFYYDANKTYIAKSAWMGINNKSIKTPSNARYIKFVVAENPPYKNDIMITLVHSGWKQDTDAGYQPYWQDILPLPIISKYFPDGMKSAGSAHDEIRYNKASGKWEYSKSKTGGGRIKSVDMGTLNWKTGTIQDGSIKFVILNFAKPIAANEKGHILTNKYITTTANENYVGTQGIAISAKGDLYIYDSAYTDVASFNAAMQGVMLYYESNDWEWVELDAEDQNFRDYYQVADFGTEMSQSSVPSAAFSADIIYQFNAVDMIREHELEITELQKVIATMQAQLTSLINGGQ